MLDRRLDADHTPSRGWPHREARAVGKGWRGRCSGLVVAVAVLAAGCSGNSDDGGQPARSGGQAATATTLADLPQPSSRCGAPDVNATVLRFPAADGTQLDGVLVGSGPAGVVLLHQHPADLCGFGRYAVYLRKRGLQALAIDLRCYGESAVALQADDAKSRVVDDVAGAVAALRAHGRQADRLGRRLAGGEHGAAGRRAPCATGRRRGQPLDRQVRPGHESSAAPSRSTPTARPSGSPSRSCFAAGAGRPQRPRVEQVQAL